MKVSSSKPKSASFFLIPVRAPCFAILCTAAFVVLPATLFLFSTSSCNIRYYCEKRSNWTPENKIQEEEEEEEQRPWVSRNLWGIIAVGSPRVPNRCQESSCARTGGDSSIEGGNGNNRSMLGGSGGRVKCPRYFGWIDRDLDPWRKGGISRALLDTASQLPIYESSFRAIVKDGRLYAAGIGNCYQTRAVFSLWGLLQLLAHHRGLVPDVELVFGCGDKPSILRPDADADAASVNATAAQLEPPPVPVFRYCTTPHHLDIPFPDWSFWGWPEVNIQPWEIERRSIEDGAATMKWKKRRAKAFWRGNIHMGEGTRRELTKCSASVAEISNQDWDKEVRNRYRNSKLSAQCKHRYKVYVEGIGWSVSLKYILACDSPVLQVEPKYLDFFSRGLVPNKHVWPVPPASLCPDIASKVRWGNQHMSEAMEVGRAGSEFVKAEVSMERVYDYMLHLLREYAKLQDFEPAPGSDFVELCPDAFLCVSPPQERPFLEASRVHSASKSPPCSFPSADSESSLH